MKLSILKEEDFNFFKKEEKKNKKKRSKFSMVLFLALILDGTLSFTSIYSQIEDKKNQVISDMNKYTTLSNKMKYDDKGILNELKSNDIIKGFDEFTPETNVGKFLLLNRYTYFMNDYYKLNQENKQNENEINKIKIHLKNSITKESIEFKKETFECNYLLHCNVMKLLLQPSFDNRTKILEEKKDKLKFELSHKDEVSSFYKLPVEKQIKMRENKEDPFSKNIW